MIFPVVNHFFDAKYPVLEDHEEEIFYTHPVWTDVQVNQLGVIFFDEDKYTVNLDPRDQYRIRKKGETDVYCLGNKAKIAMECFSGINLKGYNFFHVDGNPLNNTFKNLIFFVNKGNGIEPYKKQKREFIKRTLEYMKSREPQIIKRGITPIDYWEALNLPKYIMEAWKKEYGMEIHVSESRKRKTRGLYLTGDAQEALIEELQALRLKGNTQKDIMEILEIKTISRYKYLLKKTKARFDI